jgi:transcriptional regulator with XRE-family HTH domain
MAKEWDPLDLKLIVTFLRSLRKWTQERLSQASGVDRGLISDYELGKKAPTRQTLARLAAGVGLPYGYVESLLPIFRSARLAVDKVASGKLEEGETLESFVEKTAWDIGEKVRVSLVSYLIELEVLIKEEEGEIDIAP